MTQWAKWGTVACVLGLAAVAAGQQAPAPGIVLAAAIRAAEKSVQQDADAILARSDVAETDRRKITVILQRVHAAAEKSAADSASVVIDPKSTPQELQPVVAKYLAPVTAEFTGFIAQRPDLDWMKARAGAIQTVEEERIALRTGDYLNMVDDAGIAPAKAAQISKLLDACRDDLDKQKKLTTAAYVLAADGAAQQKVLADSQEMKARTLAAARAAVRAKLTVEEIAALDWQFLKEYKGIPTYQRLGYSTQGQAFTAPEDGAYALETYPDRKVLAKVTLKKGQSMGFHQVAGALKAFAADRDVDLPGATPVYWMLAEE